MATARGGKPYIWATYLSKLLGGNQCLWSAWFKSHFKYEKFELEASNLAEWNRDHSRMMRARRQELEEAGWHVSVESENEFKLEGAAAIVAGKPDIVATQPGQILIVDGKTGRERDSDWWQVLIYLFAWPISRPDLVGELRGEVHYKRGDNRISVLPSELTDDIRGDIVSMVKVIAGDAPPAKAPSRDECQRCNIGFADCPQRFREPRQALAAVAEF